ncbi:MAG: twin-arginine translocation signal domain-containing protein [Anaerolineales bacterium]|nr:twin-arginine translocation signal domain-containing protein [Anaerolineales bacterium]
MKIKASLGRRDFLKLAGATLVVAAGGSVWRAVDQGMFSAGKGPAYEAWKNWRDAATPFERIVAAGILASNPHNSQPWIFRISSSAIDLFADPSRQIGVIDPFRREMYIGLGCAIENMALASEAEGFAAAIQLMPYSADETHAAHLELTAVTPHVSDLYTAIPARHTDRSAYDTTRPVTTETLDAISKLVTGENVCLFWFADQPARDKFGEVAVSATEALVADEQQSMDSSAWWRQDWSDLQEHADGITLDAQGLNPFITGMGKFLPDGSRQQNDQIFAKNMREINVPTAATFGILAVKDGMDNSQRLECGRDWQRIHLWGTTQGLAFQPLNQMCERVDRETQLNSKFVFGEAVRAFINDDAWHAIMPFRLGYPTQSSFPSPRRGLDQVLK